MDLKIKIILTCVAICLFSLFKVDLFASKPIAAVAGIHGNSPRTLSYSLNMESHILNIIESTGRFEIIRTPIIRNELEKFGCTDEKCMLRFARNAGFAIIIAGDFEDLGESIRLTLTAYSTQFPYNGKIIYRAVYDVKAPRGMSMIQGAAIYEENAAVFVARMLEKFTMFAVVVDDNKLESEFQRVPNGTYTLYRFDQESDETLQSYKKIGRVRVKNQSIVKSNFEDIKPGDFILFTNNAKSDDIRYFYKGRKKEMTIAPVSINTVGAAIILTPFLSAAMPIASPIFGYYETSDWAGLSLWAINTTPYLYLGASSFLNNPLQLRNQNNDISQHTLTTRKFTWYMIFSGGTSLFVDAFAGQSLQKASIYENPQPFIGSQFLTAYLSLVSGGGGFFYKGYRSWGYFYFHLNNILLYSTLWQYSPQEKFENGHHIKDNKNTKNALIFTGIYGTAKIIEMVHALLTPVNIKSGTLIEEDFTILPYFSFDANFSPIFGLSGVMRF